MGVVRQGGKLFPGFQEDLLAGEVMLVSELSEGNAINVGDPEVPLMAVVVDGKGVNALFAKISMYAPLGALLNCITAAAGRAQMLVFFLPYSLKLVLI